MKRWIAIGLIAFMPAIGVARGWEGDTLGDKLKRMFSGPSATPTPARKKRKRSTSKKSPTPTPRPKPSATPAETPTASASPEQTMPATPPVAASVSPIISPETSPSPPPTETPYPRSHSRPHAPLVEPVRAMTPRPGSRHQHVENPPPGVTITSPVPTEERPKPIDVAAPSPPQTASVATPSVTPPPLPSATPVVRRKPKEPATIAPTEVVGYERYSRNVREVVDLALRLTTQNLGYKYGSADPARGGMDASGFVQYVLKQGGVKEVPRDARDQYIWVRKAGTFQAVLARSDDTFELDGLKPGDLLFWASGYNVGRDPAITDVAIFLGREKGTNQRLMIGASDGRTFKGQAKTGVSVLDFKVVPPKSKTSDEASTSIFVGYAHVPGWPNE